ncbi:hypothetical protein NQZ68_025543 [Dissostichus eleginoides]|nr:hypothetical protein NQZ68_025543 [Dissostichus eleginoides]
MVFSGKRRRELNGAPPPPAAAKPGSGERGALGALMPGPSLPLTTVRPDSTLIALTPRHIPVQILNKLC